MPKTNPKNTDQKKKPTVKTQRGFDAEAAVRAGAGAIPSMLLGQIEYLQQQIEALQKQQSLKPASTAVKCCRRCKQSKALTEFTMMLVPVCNACAKKRKSVPCGSETPWEEPLL